MRVEILLRRLYGMKTESGRKMTTWSKLIVTTLQPQRTLETFQSQVMKRKARSMILSWSSSASSRGPGFNFKGRTLTQYKTSEARAWHLQAQEPKASFKLLRVIWSRSIQRLQMSRWLQLNVQLKSITIQPRLNCS